MAQSATGIPGYVRIPTANFMEDKTIFFGISFLPKQYLDNYLNNKYNAATIFTSITFLPFLEVDFRLTKPLNLPKDNKYTVDRMPSVRFRLLKEKKWYPSVVIGIHDFGNAINFRSSYLVCSKKIYLIHTYLNIKNTIGYGTQWFNSNAHDFVGFFGGISVNCKKIKWLDIMIEYDSQRINIGSSVLFFKNIKLLVGLQGGDALTGSISYRTSL